MRRNPGVAGVFKDDRWYGQGPFNLPVFRSPGGKLLVWGLSDGMGENIPVPYNRSERLEHGGRVIINDEITIGTFETTPTMGEVVSVILGWLDTFYRIGKSRPVELSFVGTRESRKGDYISVRITTDVIKLDKITLLP